MQDRTFHLSGKDFLDVQEAAHYACVSYSQFRAKAAEHGLRPFQWMGKLVYRKVDIESAMSRAHSLAQGAGELPPPSQEARSGFDILRAAEEARTRRARRRSSNTARG